MNELRKAEYYIKRKRLAELMGTNDNYLSVLSKSNSDLSHEKTRQLEQAIKAVIKRLQSQLEEL